MSRPVVPAPRPWIYPSPEVRVLPNGLTVWLFDLPGQHVATFDLLLPLPLSSEPRALEGVGTIALNSIDEGTVPHPDGRIAELLEAEGASLHGWAKQHHTRLGGQAPARRLGPVLELFTEVLREPAYADQDIAHHIETRIARHDTALASPGSANRLAFNRRLYGDDARLGRPAGGVPTTLGAICPDDVREWHRRGFGPAHATVIVAGDLSRVPTEAFDALGAWQNSQPTLAPPADDLPPHGTGTVLVDRPDAVQSTILVGLRSVPRTDPRWAAARLGGHAMAGAFASRLNLELRERLGYTYGIHGGFGAGPTHSLFTVGGSTRSEVTIDAVLRILDRLRLGEPFGAAEIEDAKRFLIGIAPLATETSADIVDQVAELRAAGLDTTFLKQHFAALATVEPDEATQVFQELVTPENLVISITGQAERFLPELEAAGLAPEVIDPAS
ncbi:M16 family metallopeptidase [Tessaracoccus caeni]|uniref:M16 family metallopeptidase n=1 Tax=Tessaracoccus caeni TaxID=3031239 RepID=UPI0023DC28E3|nr:pitrilysin family protein [Tessaracoccus caeni]MDF1486784.1 pitrilysin family protein [Tessaracoccus caeni]